MHGECKAAIKVGEHMRMHHDDHEISEIEYPRRGGGVDEEALHVHVEHREDGLVVRQPRLPATAVRHARDGRPPGQRRQDRAVGQAPLRLFAEAPRAPARRLFSAVSAASSASGVEFPGGGDGGGGGGGLRLALAPHDAVGPGRAALRIVRVLAHDHAVRRPEAQRRLVETAEGAAGPCRQFVR